MRKQVVGAREMVFLSPHCLHTPLAHPDNGGAPEEFLMIVRHKSDPDSYRDAPVGAREMVFLSPHSPYTMYFRGKGDYAVTTLLKITN